MHGDGPGILGLSRDGQAFFEQRQCPLVIPALDLPHPRDVERCRETLFVSRLPPQRHALVAQQRRPLVIAPPEGHLRQPPQRGGDACFILQTAPYCQALLEETFRHPALALFERHPSSLFEVPAHGPEPPQ